MKSYLNLTSRAVGQIPCRLKDSGTKHHTIWTLTGKKRKKHKLTIQKKLPNLVLVKVYFLFKIKYQMLPDNSDVLNLSTKNTVGS